MSRIRLYAPQLDPEVTSLLYHAAKRRRIPMTRLASALVREGLARFEGATGESAVVHEDSPAPDPNRGPH